VKITIEEEFRRLQCPECACAYYFPEKWCTNAADDKKSWKCPNGHGQQFTSSPLETARRERDIAKQQLARAEQEAAAERRRAEAAQQETKRLKKRTAAGTCPCCQRTFSNMSIHMRKQHPEFVAENVVRMKAK
jgi:hypothetical protein